MLSDYSTKWVLYGSVFQAEDGIRDLTVTGVQTCALPIFDKTGMVDGDRITPPDRHIAAAHLCEADVSIRRGYPVTVNHPGFVDFARAVAADLLGDRKSVA